MSESVVGSQLSDGPRRPGARTPPRFWVNIDRSGGDEACWPWTKRTTRNGYGVASVRDRSVRAHREAWRRLRGEIPNGLHVCHRCDNKLCCNPGHMFLGTAAQNIADKVAKGRQARGSSIAKARLTEDLVRAIRSMPSSVTSKDIANELGVDRSTVGLVRQGKTWRHVA